ncbi:hypothetical protein [Bradyrhizobium ivorense]|uniref:hypothetical protein n=1 Tax=Bradyrhizobium TaxID=374 RepID=UPI00355814A6
MARIVAALVASGDSVCSVARRHGSSPRQLFAAVSVALLEPPFQVSIAAASPKDPRVDIGKVRWRLRNTHVIFCVATIDISCPFRLL